MRRACSASPFFPSATTVRRTLAIAAMAVASALASPAFANTITFEAAPGGTTFTGPVTEATQADWPWIGADQAQIMEQSQMVLERRDRFRLGACLEEVDRIGVERALMAR